MLLNRFKKVNEAPASLKVVVTPGPEYSGEHFEVVLWELPNSAPEGWQEGQLSIPDYPVDSIQVRKEWVEY